MIGNNERADIGGGQLVDRTKDSGTVMGRNVSDIECMPPEVEQVL
jgi:hypothetical protein